LLSVSVFAGVFPVVSVFVMLIIAGIFAVVITAAVVMIAAVKSYFRNIESAGNAVFKGDDHVSGEQIPVGDFTASGWGAAHFAFARHIFGKFQISFVFKFKTAFEAAADSGNRTGSKGEILFFCHADVDRIELFEKGAAAERTAADGDAAAVAGFVADTDLAQFDTGGQRP
jgi:hypothetical protein